jgi:O-antigen ligase
MTASFRPNVFAATILLAIIALSPLPLGSTAPTSVAVECGLLAVAAITLTLRGVRNAHLILVLCLSLVPLAYAVVIHEQVSETPWFAHPSPWWATASAALNESLSTTPSVVRDQPWFALGAPLLASLALLNALIVGADRVWARRLVDWALWVGSVYAAFGIVSFLSDPTHIFSFEKYAYRDVLTATFINRNTAAVYFGGCLVLAAVKVAVVSRERDLRQIRYRVLGRVLPAIPRKMVFPAVLCLVNLIAMLMTASRAGVVLSILAGVVAVALVFRSELKKRRSFLAAFILAVVLFGTFLAVIAGAVTNRFAAQGVGDGGRYEIYEATLRLVKDNWLFGTGLGTFRWSFSPYRPDDVPIWGIWDRAHNTILEMAAETGAPLALTVLVAAAAIAIILAKGAVTRQRDRDIPIAALGIALIGFAHAMVDFSLQIPGYAVTAFALIGAGLAQSFSSKVTAPSDGNFNVASRGMSRH